MSFRAFGAQPSAHECQACPSILNVGAPTVGIRQIRGEAASKVVKKDCAASSAATGGCVSASCTHPTRTCRVNMIAYNHHRPTSTPTPRPGRSGETVSADGARKGEGTHVELDEPTAATPNITVSRSVATTAAP